MLEAVPGPGHGMAYGPGVRGERQLARRRATEAGPKGGVRVVVLFLLLVLVAAALGIIGAAAEGLGYLLAIGIVVLVADVAFAAVRLSRRGRRSLR